MCASHIPSSSRLLTALTVLAVVLTSLLCISCSGGRPDSIPVPANALAPAVDVSPVAMFGVSKGALPPQPEHSGMPSLESLDGLGRGVSVTAPGWYETSVQYPVGRMGATFAPAGVTLDSNAINGLAYLIFSANGFEPDSGPTGARFTVSAVTGQYWVGFSDFVAGKWVFSGPFGATAEAEIPNTTPYTSWHSFISPRNTHYFCILAPLGTVLTVTKAELGVHGGIGAPRPPDSGVALAEYAGTNIVISPSPDCLDPDFAGYLYQRAPLLSGDFETQFGGVTIRATKYDFTATRDQGYRWRVCAVDTSGNQSIWVTLGNADAGPVGAPPVAHATFPSGVLRGPVSFDVDMGASFDPNGDAITTYRVIFDSVPGMFSNTGPLVSVTLQPGCYNVVAMVQAGADFGFSFYRIKVYPQWESTSNVVSLAGKDIPGFGPSLLRARISRAPDGKFAMCGVGDGFDFDVHYEAAPGALRQWSAPLYKIPTFVGEPLWQDGSLFCPIGTSEGVFCVLFDPDAEGGAGRITQLDMAGKGNAVFYDPPPSDRVAISLDSNGVVWSFFQMDNSGSFDVAVRNVSAMQDPQPLLFALPAIEAIDAELRANGMICVVIATPASTDEYEFDPATQTLTPISTLAVAPLPELDLEMNPATDLPSVAYFAPFPTDRVYFTEKDGMGVWSAAIPVENSTANLRTFRLLYDGAQAYIGLAYGGQAAIYEVDALTSAQRNAPLAFGAVDFNLDMCIASPNGTGDIAMLSSLASNGSTEAVQLDAGGNETPLLALPSTQRQGFDLQAACEGPGNIHAIWGALNAPASTKHFATSNGGDTWSEQSILGLSPTASLGSNVTGDLALSVADGLNHRLYSWDSVGGFWVDEGMTEPGDIMMRPCLSNDPYASELVWLHYNDATTKLRCTTGVPGAFASWDVPSNLPELWMGAVIGPESIGASYHGFLVGGGTEPSSGYVHWSEDGNNTWVFSPYGNDPYCALTQIATYGRTFAGARFARAGAVYSSPQDHVFYTTHGDTFSPQRFVYPPENGESVSVISALPGNPNEVFTRELRRTVSAYPAWGRTAVAVVSGYDGVEQYMEWSNFGEFEELPMPEIGPANYTCIIVGQDGRWHLIYHDVSSDAILCRSTY